MNTLNFLDANVWLALLWSQHVHSEQARDWFERSTDEQFFFCRFAQITVLRLVTTREVMGKDTKNMAEAWNVWIKSGQITALRFFPSQMARKQAVAQIGAGGIGEPRAFTTAVLLSEFFEGVENYFFTNFNKA